MVEELLEGAVPHGSRGVGVAPLDEFGGELGIGDIQGRRHQVHEVGSLDGRDTSGEHGAACGEECWNLHLGVVDLAGPDEND